MVTTVLLVAAALAVLALIAVPPVRAVREDRGYASEEHGWLEDGHFPAEVRREYRHSRLILTDGARLRELGYEPKQRRMVRAEWGRIPEVLWRAAGPPAIAEPQGGAGEPPDGPHPAA